MVKYKNRHVVEAKLALLAQASIYFKYWLYAFLAIIFLKNKMFSSMLNFEPFIRFFLDQYLIILSLNPLVVFVIPLFVL